MVLFTGAEPWRKTPETDNNSTNGFIYWGWTLEEDTWNTNNNSTNGFIYWGWTLEEDTWNTNIETIIQPMVLFTGAEPWRKTPETQTLKQ